MAQEEVTEETLTMLQALRDAVALGSLQLDFVPIDPSNMRGPSEDTLRARVIRYIDEIEEEWNQRRRRLAVQEVVETWLTTGGPVPKLKNLAECEGFKLENTIFGRVIDKFQTHYEQC